jgi:hypothetical protein
MIIDMVIQLLIGLVEPVSPLGRFRRLKDFKLNLIEPSTSKYYRKVTR